MRKADQIDYFIASIESNIDTLTIGIKSSLLKIYEMGLRDGNNNVKISIQVGLDSGLSYEEIVNSLFNHKRETQT